MKRHLLMLVLTALMAMSAVTALAADSVFTIEDAYNAALGTNEFVKIAEESVTQSGDRIDQARTYVFPRLVARSAYTRFNETLPPGGGSFIFQPTDQFQAALVLTQPLYTGGRTLAALRTAQQYQDVSRSGLSITKQDILVKVAEAYYGVLKAQKFVEISVRSLERMERHKEVTEREASTRKTKANVSALLRANTLVSQSRINLVRAQDGLRVAREKLGLLTGMPMDAVVSEPMPLEQPAANLESLKETALQKRDDLAGSKLGENIAAENVTIVAGGHRPQLYAEAGLQYQDSRPATLTDATTYYGGLRLQIPIFEAGLMKAEVSEARSRERQARLSTEFLRKSIESEVHEAYVNLQTVTSVMETAKLQMDYAKANFDAVESMFGEGLVTSLALIDAEQTLNMAERELVNATYDRQVSILRLRKSIGMMGKES